jgi:hypothetical protein
MDQPKAGSIKGVSKAKLAPLLPGDHGAYAMLLVPEFCGLVVGWMQGVSGGAGLGAGALLLTLALLGSFFAYEPLDVLTRPGVNPAARQRAQLWLALYLGIAVTSGLLLILVWQRWGLVLIGLGGLLPPLAYLIAKKWRRQRSLGVRLAGIAGLTLSAPAAFYLFTGRWDGLALGLWLAALVYFGSNLFYVRAWFEVRKQAKINHRNTIPGWLLRATLAYLGLGLLALLGFIGLGWLPWTVLLIFTPLVVKLAMAWRRPPVYLPIKQIGLFEFSQSFIFALLLIFTLR